MNPTALPWCLHWTDSGELESDDRDDLFLQLTDRESGWIRMGLARACQGRPAAAESCVVMSRLPL